MANNKQVLYLTHDGLCDPLGQSQILPYLIGLHDRGYQFTLISFEKPDAYAQHKTSLEHICEQHNLNWIPLVYHQSPPVLATLFDVWQMYRQAKKVITSKSINLIHCRSYVTSLVGLSLKKKCGVSFLFDMRGFWADERVEGNLWNLKNPLYRTIYKFFKKKEKEFWQGADEIISLTENAKQELLSQAIQATVTVIPTCVDLNHFNSKKLSPDNRTKQREALGIANNSFLLVYSGSWGTWYLTADMLRFFECLYKQNRDARFLILSPDPVSISNDFSQIIIHRKASRGDMPALLACADVSVFFIKPSFSKKASSATKLGELLAMQLPVVTNAGWGDIQDFHGNGVMVLNDLSTQSLETGVKWMATAKPSWPNSHLEKLSLTFGVNQYSSVYQRLLN